MWWFDSERVRIITICQLWSLKNMDTIVYFWWLRPQNNWSCLRQWRQNWSWSQAYSSLAVCLGRVIWVLSLCPQNLWGGAELRAPALEGVNPGWAGARGGEWGDFRTLNWDVNQGAWGWGGGTSVVQDKLLLFQNLAQGWPRKGGAFCRSSAWSFRIQMTPAEVVSILSTSGGECGFSNPWNICLLWLDCLGADWHRQLPPCKGKMQCFVS